MKTISTIILALLFSYNLAIAQDTLYIYKSGLVVSKRAVTDVDSIIFYKSASGNTITDYDGNVYNIVTIGTQTWMAANLKTTHFADGTAIPLTTGNNNWDTLTAYSKAYCWYDDDSAANANTYGALYTWPAAMNGAASSSASPSGIQGVCPTGWHLPSDAEWTTLTDYLGGKDVAGGKLKETDTIHWHSPNEGATNESGFTALPGGYRTYLGAFCCIGGCGGWWSSTEDGKHLQHAWYLSLDSNYSNVYRGFIYERNGDYVRCLRDY